ncbi:MAG: biopolymer transporter ExbD [Phycisphaerales bacterium]|nr:biopolymer transporter ExbD [Phycisphaerales bacterium]MCI0630343.1 biopolymer transporter ExbD [Phycisphaerales bacterium]
MRFNRRQTQRNDFGVVVTSMLDINFLLIMFFMMTAHFQRETHSRLALPQEAGETQPQPDEAGLVINITQAGDIVVSGKTINLQDLRELAQAQVAKLAQDNPAALKLMVRADRNANTQDLNRVVSMLRELGVGTIRIATEVPI